MRLRAIAALRRNANCLQCCPTAIESHTSDEKVKRLLWLKDWPFHFLLLKYIILKVSSQLVVLPSKILFF